VLKIDESETGVKAGQEQLTVNSYSLLVMGSNASPLDVHYLETDALAE
jgi:hypothetical protein